MGEFSRCSYFSMEVAKLVTQPFCQTIMLAQNIPHSCQSMRPFRTVLVVVAIEIETLGRHRGRVAEEDEEKNLRGPRGCP